MKYYKIKNSYYSQILKHLLMKNVPTSHTCEHSSKNSQIQETEKSIGEKIENALYYGERIAIPVCVILAIYYNFCQ